MITDKVIWPKHYDPTKADINVKSEIKAPGVTAEELWPYLINMADMSKLNKEIVDVEPSDSNVNDPHLKAKERFRITTSEYTADLHVLECIAPKGDRPGRISWEGSGKLNNSEKTFNFIQAVVLGVEKGDVAEIMSAMSVTGKVLSEQYFEELNENWISNLIKYVEKK